VSIAALLIAAQIGASFLARASGVHKCLVAQLEGAFGRTVEVRHFNILLLPRPVLDAEQVSIGEDPAFGNEYFLRAEHLTGGLRWSGLLRGHFEFGTLSLSRPSLILVRNDGGNGIWSVGCRRRSRRSGLDHSSMARALNKRLRTGCRKSTSMRAASISKLATKNYRSRSLECPAAWSKSPPADGACNLSAAVAQRRDATVHGYAAGCAATSREPRPVFNLRRSSYSGARFSLADLFRLLRGQDYGVRGVFRVGRNRQERH